MFTKLPIYRLTNNIVERPKVSSIERSLDNRIYERNPRNADFDADLPFDGDESLIDIRRIYCINDNILFRQIDGSIICKMKSQMKDE